MQPDKFTPTACISQSYNNIYVGSNPEIYQPSKHAQFFTTIKAVHHPCINSFSSFQNHQPTLSRNNFVQQYFDTLNIKNEQQCTALTGINIQQVEQLFNQDWPNFTHQLLKKDFLDDKAVWTLFNAYSKSKWNMYDNQKIYSKQIADELKKRSHIQQQKIVRDQKSFENKCSQQKQLVEHIFGCNSQSVRQIIEHAVQQKVPQHQFVMQVSNHLSHSYTNEFGLLPQLHQTDRAQALGFDEQPIPQHLQNKANAFLALRQTSNLDQTTQFLAEQGLDAIASCMNEQDQTTQEIYAQHADQIYKTIQSDNYHGGNIDLECNPNMNQEIKSLHREFSEITNPDKLIEQRQQALEQTIQSPNTTYKPEKIQADVIGFIRAQGLDEKLLFNYQHNPIQHQICHEALEVIQSSLAITHGSHLQSLQHSVKLFHRAIAKVSQQSLLCNRVGQIHDALESLDLGWILTEYGPDILAGACDSLLAPIQLAAAAGSEAYHVATHPLESLQAAYHGLTALGSAIKVVNDLPYQACKSSCSYFATHNLDQIKDDAQQCKNVGIELMGQCAQQGYEIIKATDPHQAVRTGSCIATSCYIAPVVQAQAVTSVATFTKSVQPALVANLSTLKTASTILLIKAEEKSKFFTSYAQTFFKEINKQCNLLLQEFVKQPKKNLITSTGTTINPSTKEKIINTLKKIIPARASPCKQSFVFYNNSTELMPGLEKFLKFSQVERFAKYTDNFKNTSILEPYQILYLNRMNWFIQELERQGVFAYLKAQKISIPLEGKLIKIKDWNLIHTFLGDIFTKSNNFGGGVHVKNYLTKDLYRFFQKNLTQAVGHPDPKGGYNTHKTFFHGNKSFINIVKDGVERLKKTTELDIFQKDGATDITIFSKSSSKSKIQYFLNPLDSSS